MLEQIASWVGPIATIIAACMTAANLGARVTGWGFVVFTIGSIAWLTLGFVTGQQSLLVANGFLLLANAVGIYRWLGRQAKYEDGSKVATYRSARAKVPTLFSAGSMVGAKVLGKDGKPVATVVDAMLRCKGRDISYLVVSGGGGLGGVGDRLYLLDPALVDFSHDGLHSNLTEEALQALPEVQADNWPAALPGHAEAPSQQPALRVVSDGSVA